MDAQPEGLRRRTRLYLALAGVLLLWLGSIGWTQLLRMQRRHHGRFCCPASAQVLEALYHAERAFHQRATPTHRYAGLRELKWEGASPVGEGEMERTSGYVFTSIAGADHYTIVAIPPKTDMTTYSLMETGQVTPTEVRLP